VLLLVGALALLVALAIAGFVIVANARRVASPETELTLGSPDSDAAWRVFRASMSRRLSTVQRRIRAVRAREAKAGVEASAAESLLVLADSLLADLARSTAGLGSLKIERERLTAKETMRVQYDTLRSLVKRATERLGGSDYDSDSLDAELKRLTDE
jgi:hypothetical protein